MIEAYGIQRGTVSIQAVDLLWVFGDIIWHE